MKICNDQPANLFCISVCAIAIVLAGAGCNRSEANRDSRQAGAVTDPVSAAQSDHQIATTANPPETNTVTANARSIPDQDSGIMQASRKVGDKIIYTQNFPPGPSALLKVEQQMPAEVRVGQPFQYTIQVANSSRFPVHEVRLRETASETIEITDISHDAAPSEPSPSMASRNQRQPARDQETDQERIQVRAQVDSSDSSSQENSTNSQAQTSASEKSESQDSQKQQASPAEVSSNTNRPPQLSQSNEQDGSSNILAPTNQWTLGTLEPGETRTLRVTAVSRQVGEAKTCLLVDYQPSLCAQIKVVKPELAFQRLIVNQEGKPVDQAYACDPLFILYRVSNDGSGKTDPVTIRESLPEWIAVSQGSHQINLEVGELEAGQKVEKKVPVQVTQSGQFSSRAEATTGNIRAQSSRSSVRILQPQLQVNLDGPAQDYLNRAIRYTVVVSNPSQDPASNTVVSLEIPKDASRMTYSSQQVEKEGNQFKLGTLNPGESKSFTIAFEASQPGQFTTRATAQAYCAKAQSAELVTQVQGVPAVRLEVVDLKDPVPLGEETTYAIRVKNQGTAKDLNIQIQAQLPKELKFVSAQGDSNVQSSQQGLKFAPLKELPPGATAEWLLKAKADQTNKVMFKVQMSTDSIAQNVTETESTTLY